MTVEEVAGPCQNVVPDLLIDAKYNVLGFDMEKNAFENGVAVHHDLVKLSHARRDDVGGIHFTNAVRGGLGGKTTVLFLHHFC